MSSTRAIATASSTQGTPVNRSAKGWESHLAEIDRILIEQNAELDAAFARLESLDSASIQVNERELAELADCRSDQVGRSWQSLPLAPRC
jgi:hypothetical protein